MNVSPLSPSPTQSAFQSSAAPDVDLITRCREGDIAAFDVLVERHQDRIFNLCYWTLGNREEAADAAQDAFVRAFRSLANFRGDSSFGTWLHRIAVNVAIDATQRRKRAPLPYSDLAAPGEENEAAINSASIEAGSAPGGTEPEQIALRRERSCTVRAAVARLPEHYRIALVLFDIEGHSYQEISEALELPLGTVKSRINRARAQLHDELSQVRELFED